MLDALRVWWVILTQIGLIGPSRQYAETWIRFFVIDTLKRDGFFDFFAEARNYGQVVAHFGFVDSDYTRELMETLSSGRRSFLKKVGGRYQRNTKVALPTREAAVRATPAKFHEMSMWEDLARRIPARLRQEPIDFFRKMAQEEPTVLRFDHTLNSEVYAALRKAAFAYIDTAQLRGARLLDIACGSGYETADIWRWLHGDVQLTAVDAEPGLLHLAEQHFEEMLDADGGVNRAELTAENRPSFHVMSAMDLDFPDASFDAVFHSLLLHWTPHPEGAIQEIARVLKPGGLVFGMQITKPLASSYINLITRVYQNVYGYFWEEDLRQWYERAGVHLSIATPAGVFKGHKRP
jgi:ubiquinone/menaquinone biosynthesis C-methylase UbiE